MTKSFVHIPIILAVPGLMHGRLNVVGNDDYVAISGFGGLLQRPRKQSFALMEAQVRIARAALDYSSTIVLLGIQTPELTHGTKKTAEFLYRHTRVSTVIAICSMPATEKLDVLELIFYKLALKGQSENINQIEIPQHLLWIQAIQFARQQLLQLRAAA